MTLQSKPYRIERYDDDDDDNGDNQGLIDVCILTFLTRS
jgi:hypothetical protein